MTHVSPSAHERPIDDTGECSIARRSNSRREFLMQSGAWAVAWQLGAASVSGYEVRSATELHLATFRFDVTPPIGHSCCGGWTKPVEVVDDALEALGLVLLGAGKPIVIAAIDWTGVLNDAHVQWRRALAEAAGTTPDRVAVQCVHQHNAPFACLEAERIVAAQGDLPHILDVSFFQRCLDQAKQSVARAITQARPVSHVAHGQARVEQVASNRRVSRDAMGRVKAMRGSSCRDAALRDLPEGLIDPWLKTVAFYDQEKKIAALHYYATHPMSYYGDGRVSSDFVGLARKLRQRDEPDCMHIYFTGCAGDIAAGKYNDGSKEMRPLLVRRMYDAIAESEKNLQLQPIEAVAWHAIDVVPTPRDNLSAETIEMQIADKSAAVVNRNRPSFQLAWLRRLKENIPIVLSALHVNQVRLLHLPSECFLQYQLRAQSLRPSAFVATAAYGDGGPWYIPTQEEYPYGGYEVSVAFCDPTVDGILTRGIEHLI